ncbi:hypothetical protein PAAG_03054 [Paracoccidioides lutzii Pb01]|uniref:G2/M phase checkpoint control protein Sum2 n=1 Tax=Paracoccidioides lutzii (strain ATCC MYA-826 / Pb01) TaxID=502779 RepID=C1GYA0_PARBA|nr:hypothetical protein PAAG_03054 [Paracoccidioides lutzii Pb01]EEH41491.2 hypothetical protein PAAG_03054 [Paracoccidioides lutzii Pb01]
MDMNHFIGQRFNLISKSDIRYVGTLHEINPEDSTIALENVISHGTEGRRGNPAEEIAPSASVYEYIVFRGSDVKDISVAEEQKENQQSEPPQVPNDPAILGSGMRPGPPQGPPRGQANQTQFQPPGRQPPPGYQQPPFPGYYTPYGQRFGPPGFPPGPGFPNAPYGAPQGWYPGPGQGFQQPPGHFPPPQVPIGTPQQQQQGQQAQQQRPGAPQPPSSANVPKPTSELPVGDKISKPTAPSTSASVPPSEQLKTSVSEQATPTTLPPTSQKQVTAPTAAPTTAPPLPSTASGTASKAPPPGPNASGPMNGRVVPAIPIHKPHTTSAAMQDATRAATAAVAAAMAKLPQPPSQVSQPTDKAVEAVTKKVSEMKPLDGEKAPRGTQQNTRGGRGGHRGSHYHPQPKKVEVPTTDYDFESANAKFNKQDLVKEAIASGAPLGESEHKEVNGTSPTESADKANGTGANIAYNKASSFFDNISSESRDREEGIRGKTSGREWRGEEEKKNIETFGQGSIDGGYRSGYRGRGRGRGSGAPRGARGSYTRSYSGGRGRGGFRGGRGAPQAAGVSTSS